MLQDRKINTQKSIALLYINNKITEKNKKIIPFAITKKRIRYLKINNMNMKNLYTNNYKTSLKIIEGVTN